MGRTDLWEETARRFDVVMVAGDARLAKGVELCSRQQAVRGTEADMKFALHGPVRIEGLFKVLSRKGPAGGNDGEAVGTGILIGLGIGHDFFFRQEIVFIAARMVTSRLGAVFTVFAAAAAAAVDDGTEVDVVAAEMALQYAGPLFQFIQRCRQEELRSSPRLMR